VRSLTPGGVQKIIGVTATRLTLSNGQEVGYVYTFADLTDIKRLERRGQDARPLDALWAGWRGHRTRDSQRRSRLSPDRSKVLSHVSKLTEEQQSLVDIVIRESERLNAIISDFLN